MDKSSEVLVRPNRFNNPIVFSDGIGSSGKRMLGHILASFEGIEKMSHHFVFDYAADLHWLGKMSDDGARAYLQIEADRQIYQLMLSRDQNFRPGDTTSVLSDSNPWRYIARLFSKEGDPVVKRIGKHRPWLHEAPHDGLRKAGLYFSALGDRLRIVHIVRNPIDLVADLIRRGFDWRVGVDPREFQFTLLKNRIPIPIVLKDLDRDFSRMQPSDLAALTVQESMKHNLGGLRGLGKSDRDRVRVVFFDDFCKDPGKEVMGLSKFLGVSPTARTKRAVGREHLPRSLPDRAAVLRSLETDMTIVGITALRQATAMYEEFRKSPR